MGSHIQSCCFEVDNGDFLLHLFRFASGCRHTFILFLISFLISMPYVHRVSHRTGIGRTTTNPRTCTRPSMPTRRQLIICYSIIFVSSLSLSISFSLSLTHFPFTSSLPLHRVFPYACHSPSSWFVCFAFCYSFVLFYSMKIDACLF